MGADIASANYQQEPIDLKGRLYTSFKTYSGGLPQFKEIRNYTDTADTGGDYLCSINYGVTFANEAYVLDVLYTKEPMEVTEPARPGCCWQERSTWQGLSLTMAAVGLHEMYAAFWAGTGQQLYHDKVVHADTE